jgi:hypothetical protein
MEKVDRGLDPPPELPHIKLLVRAVGAVVRQPKAQHHGRDPQLLLEQSDDGQRPTLAGEHRLHPEDLLAGADGGAYPNVLLRNWVDLPRVGPVEAIARLDELYRSLLGADGGTLLDDVSRRFRACAETLLEPATREAFARRQRRNVLDLVGDFDGARAIAAAIGRELSPRAAAPAAARAAPAR